MAKPTTVDVLSAQGACSRQDLFGVGRQDRLVVGKDLAGDRFALCQKEIAHGIHVVAETGAGDERLDLLVVEVDGPYIDNGDDGLQAIENLRQQLVEVELEVAGNIDE